MRQGQGLGLGLAIAERIAHLLDAPLALRSRPDRGAMFAITLSRAMSSPLPKPMPSAMAADRPALHVLAVDNEPQALQALRRVLEAWGHRVSAVGDGDAAQSVMSRDPAALWLFDYHLDAGDTGTALHARLAQRFGAHPTLILSADDGLDTRREVLDAGLTLLQKPVRPLALKSVLDRLRAGIRPRDGALDR